MRVVAVAILSLLFGLLASPISATRADQGVAVDLGNILIDQELSPGGRYRLPTLTVTNVGDSTGDYEVAITYLQDTAGSKAPAAWFDFTPQRFRLDPAQAEHVEIHISVPASANPGTYNALIEAHPMLNDGGVHVTAAAASRLSFRVRPSSLWRAWLLQTKRSFADHLPWSLAIPFSVLAILAVYLSRRFVRVRVGIERAR